VAFLPYFETEVDRELREKGKGFRAGTGLGSERDDSGEVSTDGSGSERDDLGEDSVDDSEIQSKS
jgi:hypothetical protein